VNVSVAIGLVFAVATAFVSIVGFLLKQRGAVSSPEVSLRRPVRSTFALFSNRWWTIGILVAMGSWAFHVTALALAPISLVQSVIAGGLVLLTVVADRLFGVRVTRREWIGVALVALGLAVLAATSGHVADSARSDYGASALLRWVLVLTVVGLALCLLPSVRRGGGAMTLALSAGLLWAASDVTIKALSSKLSGDGVGVLIDPMALVILLLSLVGLVVSARSLQLGDAVPVIAVTSAAANVCTIAAGPLVFLEPMPSAPGEVALRVGAFVLVVVAAMLTPGPAVGGEAVAEAVEVEAA
jgi:multidrug transporter EmrE-like cation transporter